MPLKKTCKKIHQPKFTKKNLPSKICVTCQRQFLWRKKWRKDWESVKYCSKSCSKSFSKNCQKK
ncbi:MAG: DUF2256 domain-containing protein [Rickettsiales bacterium]|nr:DUF2256 domain-containing protein [Rickettsiales bacterium]